MNFGTKYEQIDFIKNIISETVKTVFTLICLNSYIAITPRNGLPSIILQNWHVSTLEINGSNALIILLSLVEC